MSPPPGWLRHTANRLRGDVAHAQVSARNVMIMIDGLDLAEAVRSACLQAALDAYEQAGVSGLCGEGRWEIAVQAIRNLDLVQVIEKHRRSQDRRQ
ncbi:hypothetical protein [uncultured Lamprocystis sp.]|jgi:hypothetical protein|uniref:hypothetical protein n=1 Tax=uncultured Lamprocystis sp. TaxID=543132 RepID=UPI0025DBD614|nr:hypothetical protein [uncultured Lamprocystis sp.]